jgi:hypothetical protein
MKTIQDEFTDLPVSRQRKKQLRWKRDGKCVLCGRPLFTTQYCKEHHKKHVERDHARNNRRPAAWSKYKDGILRKTLSEQSYELVCSGWNFSQIAEKFGTSYKSARASACYWAKKHQLPRPWEKR